MAYSSMGAGGAGSGLDDLSDPRTSLSSSQYVAPYPYDVDVSSCATPGASSWMSTAGRSGGNPARSVYGGVRQFLCRTLKQVHFSSGHESRPMLPLERPKRPDKNLQALCRLTQLTKEELKKFYRAFKQECPLGVAEPKHFRLILTKYFPLGDCSSYATCLFNAFDPQRKGYLTFEEMVLAISSLSRGSLSEKLRWVFSMYDANGDGVIHKSEIKDVIVAAFRLGGHHHGLGPIGKKSAPSSGNHPESSSSTVAATTSRSCHQRTRSTPAPLLSSHQQQQQQQANLALMDELINQQTDKVFQKLDVNRDGAVTMETFLQVCLQDQSIIASIERLSSDLS